MILVFAGAGASSAVSSTKYPTTLEYFNKLPKAISQNEFFLQTVQDISSKGEPLDIENVLFRLKALQAFVMSHPPPKSPDTQIINDHRNFIKKSLDSKGFGIKLDKLINDININVFHFYNQIPDSSEINNNWVSLANLLLRQQQRIELFTTNYDQVLNKLLKDLRTPPISDGFVEHGIKAHVLDLTKWQKNDSNSNEGLLTKLHGCVTWLKQGQDIVWSTGAPSDDSTKHPLIFPGYKGIPNTEPFRTFHTYFEKAMHTASHIIVIGFAFRDPSITNIFARLPRHTKVTCIGLGEEPIHTPAQLKTNNSNYNYIDSGFGPAGITELQSIIETS